MLGRALSLSSLPLGSHLRERMLLPYTHLCVTLQQQR